MNSILQELKIIFVVFSVFIVLDLPMLLLINNKMYQLQLERINKNDKVTYTRMLLSAAITYLLLAIGIYYFAVKQNNIYNGAILGVVVYGVYNFTNLATISKYGVRESVIDTAWGTILCALITYVVLEINARFLSGSGLKSSSSSSSEIQTTTDIPSN